MLFSEIIGQQAVKSRLIKSVKENRVGHAQLFLGSAGSGNLALAVAYAQYISCENRSEEDSCGKCLSCIKYNKLIHPDLHFTFPIITVKEKPTSKEFMPEWRMAFLNNPYMDLNEWMVILDAENKQPLIPVAESVEIIRRLSLKSYESEYKISIIWMPEKMNKEAANTLLKMLEEPPDKTVFILVAKNHDIIISTILSRTQLIKINRLSDKELTDALMLKLNLSKQEVEPAVRLAGGSWNEALRMVASSEEDSKQTAEYLAWMRLCFAYEKTMVLLLDMAEKFQKKGRESQKSFLLYGLHITRECLMLNYSMNSLVRLNEEEATSFQKFSPFIHADNSELIAAELARACYHIERNANPKILFLDLSFKIGHLLKINVNA